MSGVFYIIVTGGQWQYLPDYYGKPSTVHGRFRCWVKEGVFQRILDKSIDVAIKKLGIPACFFCDTSSSKAPFVKFGGKNPTDRRKNGVKRGMIIDINKVILSLLIESANRHDSKLRMPQIKHIEKFIDKPKVMSTDSAWDIKDLRKKT